MIICKTTQELLAAKTSSNIGFVPTMGALHSGHISLIERSLRDNKQTICSVFVNPTQFNNPDDFQKYPMTLAQDQQLLEQVGCDILFLPSVQEMYPEGLKTESFDFGPITQVMEGAHRPGHFDGVATVVSKLFDAVQPQKAYFGEKDFQQLCVIQALVKLKHYPIQIIPCATAREHDGLAMSSRNMRLTAEQRAEAPFIYKILQEAKNRYHAYSIQSLKQWVYQQFDQNPHFKLEYFEMAHTQTLQPLTEDKKHESSRAFIVAFMGDVRLIDNVAL